MPVYKNKASQKVPCLAYNSTTGAKVTGDAANITAQISLDGGTSAATNDTNPTELDATDHPGIYLFDLTQAETNADVLIISPVSATSDVAIEPLLIFTEPEIRDANIVSIDAGVEDTGSVTVGGYATGQSPADLVPTSSEIADAVWDEARVGHTTAGSFGEGIASVQGNVTGNVAGQVGSISGVTFPINFSDLAITETDGHVTVGTNSDKTGYALATAPPTAAAIADAVWDETLADHLTAGSTGASLNAASSAGDPWTTTLPGSYTGSQAGKILADILTDTGTTIPDTLADIQGATFDTATDSLEAIRDRGDAAWTGSGAGLTAEDVWTYATRTLTANTNFNDPTAAAIASQVRTELATELARIDAAISTRSTYAGADTSGTTTLLSRLSSARAGYLDALNTGVPLDLTQTGITFRDVSAVTDEATITVADCFAAAFVQTAGGESVVGTAYTKKRPAGTTFRAFTLDDATTPTSRS